MMFRFYEKFSSMKAITICAVFSILIHTLEGMYVSIILNILSLMEKYSDFKKIFYINLSFLVSTKSLYQNRIYNDPFD